MHFRGITSVLMLTVAFAVGAFSSGTTSPVSSQSIAASSSAGQGSLPANAPTTDPIPSSDTHEPQSQRWSTSGTGTTSGPVPATGPEAEWLDQHLWEFEIAWWLEANYSDVLGYNATWDRMWTVTTVCLNKLIEMLPGLANASVMRYAVLSGQNGNGIDIRVWVNDKEAADQAATWMSSYSSFSVTIDGRNYLAYPLARGVQTTVAPGPGNPTSNPTQASYDPSPVIAAVVTVFAILFVISAVLLYLHKGKPIVDENGFTKVHHAVIKGDARELEDILSKPPYGAPERQGRRQGEYSMSGLGAPTDRLSRESSGGRTPATSYSNIPGVGSALSEPPDTSTSLSDIRHVSMSPAWGSAHSLIGPPSTGASVDAMQQASMRETAFSTFLPGNLVRTSNTSSHDSLLSGALKTVDNPLFGSLPSVVSNPVFDAQSLCRDMEIEELKKELRGGDDPGQQVDAPSSGHIMTKSASLDRLEISINDFDDTTGFGLGSSSQVGTTVAAPDGIFRDARSLEDLTTMSSTPSAAGQQMHSLGGRRSAELLDFAEDVSITISAGSGSQSAPKALNPLRFRRLDTATERKRAELLDQRDRGGATAVIYAVRLGNVEMVTTLGLHGADVNIPTLENMTALHYACMDVHANVRLVKTLLEFGANPNALNNELSTPLSFACMNGQAAAAEALLSAGAQMQLRDCHGMTPLMHAAARNHADVVKLLCETDPSCVTVTDQSGWTALLWAVAVNAVDAARVLLSNENVSPLVVSDLGESALHLAAKSGNEEMISLLASKLASDDHLKHTPTFSRFGVLPSTLARKRNHHDATMTLLQLEHRAAAAAASSSQAGNSSTADQPRLKKYKASKIEAAGEIPDELPLPAPIPMPMVKQEPDDSPASTPGWAHHSDTSAEDKHRAASLSPAMSTSEGSCHEDIKPAVDVLEQQAEKRKKRRLYMRRRRQMEKERLQEMESKVRCLDSDNKALNHHIEQLRNEAEQLRAMLLRDSRTHIPVLSS